VMETWEQLRGDWHPPRRYSFPRHRVGPEGKKGFKGKETAGFVPLGIRQLVIKPASLNRPTQRARRWRTHLRPGGSQREFQIEGEAKPQGRNYARRLRDGKPVETARSRFALACWNAQNMYPKDPAGGEQWWTNQHQADAARIFRKG
jgi:hypothetical protein